MMITDRITEQAEKIKRLQAEYEQMKHYVELIRLNGICIRHQKSPFFRHPQDEAATELLLTAYLDKMQAKLDEVLRANLEYKQMTEEGF